MDLSSKGYTLNRSHKSCDQPFPQQDAQHSQDKAWVFDFGMVANHLCRKFQRQLQMTTRYGGIGSDSLSHNFGSDTVIYQEYCYQNEQTIFSTAYLHGLLIFRKPIKFKRALQEVLIIPNAIFRHDFQV